MKPRKLISLYILLSIFFCCFVHPNPVATVPALYLGAEENGISNYIIIALILFPVTILIELFLFKLFYYDEFGPKLWKRIIFINFFTYPLAQVFGFLINAFAEFIPLIVESIFLSRNVDKKRKMVISSIIINLISFVIGTILSIMLMGSILAVDRGG